MRRAESPQQSVCGQSRGEHKKEKGWRRPTRAAEPPAALMKHTPQLTYSDQSQDLRLDTVGTELARNGKRKQKEKRR